MNEWINEWTRKGKVSQLEAFRHFKKRNLPDIYILKCGSEKTWNREKEKQGYCQRAMTMWIFWCCASQSFSTPAFGLFFKDFVAILCIQMYILLSSLANRSLFLFCNQHKHPGSCLRAFPIGWTCHHLLNSPLLFNIQDAPDERGSECICTEHFFVWCLSWFPQNDVADVEDSSMPAVEEMGFSFFQKWGTICSASSQSRTFCQNWKEPWQWITCLSPLLWQGRKPGPREGKWVPRSHSSCWALQQPRTSYWFAIVVSVCRKSS